ncbi:MAG: integrase, partial [Planctomycetota bacterium]
KHKASGLAFVEINGRRYYLGPHGTKASHAEYDRIVTEWLASGRSSAYGAPERAYTIVELIADYLRFAKSYYGMQKGSDYGRMLYVARPLKELYGRTPAAEFGVIQWKAVRESLLARGLTRSGINDSMRRITRMFRWGAAEGKLPADVPQALSIIPGLRRGKTTAPEAPPVLPVDDATVDATLEQMLPVPADMVRLQRLTGMRPAEVCILRPCDLDRSGDVWIYRPSKHKTEHHGRERLILIGPKAQAVLLRYLARGAEDYCFRPKDSVAKWLAARYANRKTPLSCGNKPGTNRRKKPRKSPGDCYAVDAYRRAIARACDKAFPHPTLAGVRRSMLTAAQKAELAKWQSEHRWAPNQLRHAAATEVRKRFGLEAAQIVLGHSKADVTQVYAERDLAKGVQVAAAIG